MAIAAAARRRARRAGRRTPTSTRSTTSWSPASCRRRSRAPGSNVEGRDADELLKALATRRGPERVLDFMLRTGPYGDGFGADPDGLSLAVLEANPHGIDLGPLQPRMPEVLRTPTGMIELAPEPCVADVDAAARRARPRDASDGGARARRPARSALEQLVDAQPATCS